jgi:hypothetical protein
MQKDRQDSSPLADALNALDQLFIEAQELRARVDVLEKMLAIEQKSTLGAFIGDTGCELVSWSRV